MYLLLRGSFFRASLATLALILFSFGAKAADATSARDPAKAEIAKLLHDFLAYNSDAAQHDRFWAEDLIYTSSGGLVKTKAEIMKGMAESAKSTAPKAPAAKYSAEDVLIRIYGTTAALTFQLVADYPDGTKATYRNSGTLLNRNGRWQVVTWQATKEPAPAK